MDNREIAKELTVALINKVPITSVVFKDDSRIKGEGIIPEWIGKAYQTIYKAIKDAG